MTTLLGRYIVKKIVDLGYDRDFLHPPCDEDDNTMALICDSLEAVAGTEITDMASKVDFDGDCHQAYKATLDFVFFYRVTWEKLVAVAVCTYRLVMKALLRQKRGLANSYIYWLDHYVRNVRMKSWIDNHGGYVSL